MLITEKFDFELKFSLFCLSLKSKINGIVCILIHLENWSSHHLSFWKIATSESNLFRICLSITKMVKISFNFSDRDKMLNRVPLCYTCPAWQ